MPHPAGERLPPRLQLEVVELRDPVSVGHLDQLQVTADLLERSQCLLHVLLLRSLPTSEPAHVLSPADNGIPETGDETPSLAVSRLDVRHYFANLDAFESDRLRNHLRHLTRRSPRSVL